LTFLNKVVQNIKYLDKKFFHILLLIATVLGCSTKKNRFLNRKYHAMTTEYNILYNGEIAFEKGWKEIQDNYEDNYWNVLPIEPLEIKEGYVEESVPAKKRVSEKESDEKETLFEIAEAKAVKAVQKHSMLLDGLERNSKIDDAYLLLGRSRYYSQRFIPALEAFDYILKNYPEASLIKEAILWRAKTNVRLENEEVALESLQERLQEEKAQDKIDTSIVEETHMISAMAWNQLDSVAMVIHHLNEAVRFSKDKSKKARNLLILGQLYRQEGDRERSQKSFQEVIALKRIPYKYKIHAEIERAKNYTNDTSPSQLVARLQELIEIRENRPYLAALYHQLGVVHKKSGSRDLAVQNFLKSIHAKNAQNFQKGLSYEILGDLFFKEANFKNAGAYYDSVLQVSGKIKSKRIRRISKKRENLEIVLVFEQRIKRNDSILHLLSTEPSEQVRFFEKHIKYLKIKETEALKAATLQQKLAVYQERAANTVGLGQQYTSKLGGKWYFYNQETLAYGAQDFQRNWGKRELKDNWRWSSKLAIVENRSEDASLEKEKNAVSNELLEKYNPMYYIDKLPKTIQERDSIFILRNTTYYQLGLIYKEQFKETEQALEKLEKLLSYNPSQRLVLGANYQLFKMYKAQNSSRAGIYKKVVINQFPNSIFARMILQPEDYNVREQGEALLEDKYKEIYYLYKSENYKEALKEIEKAMFSFEGDKLQPKLALLRAHVLAKLAGMTTYKKALEFIVLNHVNTEEEKRAKELLKKIKSQY
jgi:tetratricopeptide (TPR) repeat protein